MTRKEWLETFLNLADRNASSIEYRQKLGLRAQKLPAFVKNIPGYRKELALLLEEDKHVANRKKKEEALNKARQALQEKKQRDEEFQIEKKRLREQQREIERIAELESGRLHAASEPEDSNSEASREDETKNDATSNTETMGPRKDSGDESDLHG